MVSISAVDLFCGAGGLTHGFERTGLTVRVGYDSDPGCRFPYEYNNKAKFILQKIEELSGEELIKHFPIGEIKVLAGCAPCQPFSNYSQRYSNQQSDKWQLLNDFARLVQESNPEIVSMENVPQLQRHQVFETFTSELKNLGYYITYYEVDCLDYGIPQTRKRLVFFASRFGEINLISPTHTQESFETVRSTIGDLEPLKDGESSKTDLLHRCSKLSPLNLRRIRASIPGGTWRDWPPDLIAKCHRKSTGQTYPAVYGRMEWDAPSPTITTQCFGFGNGRFGHPEQDRAISLREASLLQTFPGDYQFVAPGKAITFKAVGRLIGNAVPVKLGQVIAQSILNHLS